MNIMNYVCTHCTVFPINISCHILLSSVLFFPLQVTFKVTVKAATCLEKESFNISLLGFNEKLLISVKTRCECECDNQVGVHKYCNDQGKITCGTCRYGTISSSVLNFCCLFAVIDGADIFVLANFSISVIHNSCHLPHLADALVHI